MKSLFLICALFINAKLSAQTLPISEDEIKFENIKFEKQMEMATKLSSGADIVGNGSGRVEIMANYYLRQLDQTISDCLNNPLCQITKADRFVLKEIRTISIDSRLQNKKLIFLNGEDFERVFLSENDPEVRIAKTGYHKKYPIFFNLTELYKTDMDVIDRNLIAILIHELGHQTGIKSHSYLDEVAARLSFYFEQKITRINLTYHDNELNLITLNNRGHYDYSKSYLSINQQVFELNYQASKLQCSEAQYKITGVNLHNPHWKKVQLFDTEQIVKIGFWATIFCDDPNSKESKTEMIELNIDLKFDGKNYNQSNELILIKQELEIFSM